MTYGHVIIIYIYYYPLKNCKQTCALCIAITTTTYAFQLNILFFYETNFMVTECNQIQKIEIIALLSTLII